MNITKILRWQRRKDDGKVSDVRILAREVEKAKAAAKAIDASIKRTNVRCDTLLAYVASASWSGQTRDSFLTYLELIKQLHDDIEAITPKQTKALSNLAQYTDDFLNDSLVKQVRHL